MGFTKSGTWVLNTLGDVIETGGQITAFCGDKQDCGRTLDLDVYDLTIQFGRTWHHIERKFPIKCSHCGCKEVHYIMSPDTRRSNSAALRELPPGNFRASRSQEERDALTVLFPRRWEWPARSKA